MSIYLPQHSVNTPSTADRNGSIDLQKTFGRLVRLWPWLVCFLCIAFAASKFYLRYKAPLYLVSARIILNDDENQQTAELIQIGESGLIKDDRKIEKEREILLSTSMLEAVVRKRQLNTFWFSQGRFNSSPAVADVPYQLEQMTLDNVPREFSGPVEPAGTHAVRFAGRVYPLGKWVDAPFGRIKWTLRQPVRSGQQWMLTILPLHKAVSRLEGSIKASPLSKGSSIFNVTIEDPVPERGKMMLEDLFDVYARGNIEYRNRAYRNTFSFVEQRLQIVADELKDVESNLERYKSAEGVVNLSAEGERFLGVLQQLDQTVAETEVQLEVLDGVQRYVLERNRTADAAPATLGLTDPVLLNLLNQLFTTETELDRLLEVSGDNNPEVQVRRQSVRKLKQSILASIGNLRISLRAGKQKAEREIAHLRKQIKSIPQKERVLLEISRQQQVKNSIFLYLLQKREESAIAAAAQVANFRVIVPPANKGIIAPKPVMVYGIALSLALLAYMFLVFVQVFLLPKVSFADEAAALTGIQPIGMVGKVRQHNPAILVDLHSRTLENEQFRNLRTNVSLLMNKLTAAKTILVTSCISGEGKSLIARNLAATFALVKKKVVLLEFDLRKETAFRQYAGEGKGLMEYLCGTASLAEIIKPVDHTNNLDVIAAGKFQINPVDVLEKSNLDRLFSELRQVYDVIIVDTPPVMPVSDAKVLGKQADLTLFIVRQHYTPLPLLKNIAKLFAAGIFPAPNLVINGVKHNGLGYYPYGYGYSDQYFKETSGSKLRQRVRSMLTALHLFS